MDKENNSESKVCLVLQGYLNLSKAEQEQFIAQLQEFNKAKENQKLAIREGFEKHAQLSLGPLNYSGCPCCRR